MTRADTASTRLFITSLGLFKVILKYNLALNMILWLLFCWSLVDVLCKKNRFFKWASICWHIGCQDCSESFSNIMLHWTWSCDCFVNHWLVFFATIIDSSNELAICCKARDIVKKYTFTKSSTLLGLSHSFFQDCSKKFSILSYIEHDLVIVIC